MTSSTSFPNAWLRIWTAMVVVFVAGPLLFVVLVSLTSLNHVSLPTEGISLRWYAKLADNRDLLRAATNSVGLGLAAAATAVVLGTLAAVASSRSAGSALLGPLRFFATAPLYVPVAMSGLAMLMFSVRIGWGNPILRTYLAHSALTLPYVFRTVAASLAGFDRNQELAAQNLGASPLQAFFLVTLPQLGPGVIAGAFFAFIVSFDNIGISIFLTGAQFQTLPVELFSYASYSDDPMVAAASVVMLAVSCIFIIAVERLFGLQRLVGGRSRS